MSITVPGQRIVIINSYQIAVDLLEKRGAIYSDRPSLVSADIIGYSGITPALAYGEHFKEHRKMLSQTIGTRSHVDRLASLQIHEVRRFLGRLRKDPENFVEHIKRYVPQRAFLVAKYIDHSQTRRLGDLTRVARVSSTGRWRRSIRAAFRYGDGPICRFDASWSVHG